LKKYAPEPCKKLVGWLRRMLSPSYHNPTLDASLASREHFFKAPPFTEELVQAIRLVTSQYRHTVTERSRQRWETEQNASCWGEFDALGPLLRGIPKPARVLEIGPGM